MSKNINEKNNENEVADSSEDQDAVGGEESRQEVVSEKSNRRSNNNRPKVNKASSNEDIDRLFEIVENQSERLESFIEWTEERFDGKRREDEENLPRFGVFVDSANVELALDRSKGRLDWGRVLKTLTKGRRLVRAIAYSPVHEDVNVSMESQRFVEPFLGNGYKVITKPLKRFSDGTVKANVDIELAIDLLTMSDRLDIACIVSGDGDFQPLVEAVQSRGVRVEVASVGNAIASHLRKAADDYINLDKMLK
tara:strand:+ start:439 stop:1194 length:756 start_codon:yes stop_codon:yes gene_type:complete